MLGPCPECAGTVPVADIRHLADLGTHLATGPTLRGDGPVPDTFAHDEGHTPACRFGGEV
ncbi:hypothetical protein [Streptomyces sp. NPDC059928]|uniref:hypothetical protein n=1 Tax=unclassified Streptomyces TaxID=2593676 RepID=UPI00365DD9DF